jgi:hypothetical protein
VRQQGRGQEVAPLVLPQPLEGLQGLQVPSQRVLQEEPQRLARREVQEQVPVLCVPCVLPP